MPRQPWGLESESFVPLKELPELKELVVRSGRLIGSHDVLVSALLDLKNLCVLEVYIYIPKKRSIFMNVKI